jgi:nitrite reductase/ring-hydroxylating ferredoxin subunit
MTEDAYWHAVALSSAVEPGTTSGVVVESQELVIWRDQAGTAHVWEDRCPHRGMRLSFGAVRGDRLACLYHGWQYDGAGQCRAIPAHPELVVPKTIKVMTYQVTEAFGMIWMSPAAEAPGPIVFDAPAIAPLRSLTLDCPLSVAVEGLGNTDLPGFAGTGSTRFDAVEGQPALWTLGNDTDRLLIAGQVIDGARSALHMVIVGEGKTYRGAGQIHFARWAEQFRAGVELPSRDAA